MNNYNRCDLFREDVLYLFFVLEDIDNFVVS